MKPKNYIMEGDTVVFWDVETSSEQIGRVYHIRKDNTAMILKWDDRLVVAKMSTVRLV